jgi:PmbA protein
MMKNVLAAARGKADEAEVFSVSSDGMHVQFEANRLKHIQNKQSTSVALRIIKQGRTGYATATEPDARRLVDMALETAQFGSKAEFVFPDIASYPEVETFDPTVESVTTETMAQLGEEMIARLTGHTPELVCDASITRSTVSVGVINSRRGRVNYKQSVFSFGVGGTLVRDNDMLFVGDSQSSCHPLLETTPVTEMAIKQLELAREQATIPTGSMPVIFTPHGIASSLVGPLMAAFNGKTVLEGASPITTKMGQKVFDTKLDLGDDPTIAYRPASRPCDDEGVPSQRTPLIQQGVVSNFLYDLQTAALAKTRSTGNGQRSRGSLPSPSPSAFVVSPGSVAFNDMVSDMEQGLVVEQLMGASQGNVLGGDFSGNVLLGYRVENGKIIGRVKNTMVSGNIYQLLKDISAIGSDARWVGGFLYTPSFYLPNVAVATKEQVSR